jgi:hypothetical protein
MKLNWWEELYVWGRIWEFETGIKIFSNDSVCTFGDTLSKVESHDVAHENFGLFQNFEEWQKKEQKKW